MKHPLRSAVTTTGRRMAGARSLWRANGMREEQFGRPIIGIANSFTQLVPGHVHLHEIGQQVKQRIEACGCFAAEFNTIAVDDGIAMGHDGMLYSLPSREIIADSVEYMANAHCIDALVCISNCDKITPGMLMAAMRLNIPTVFVSGGPMEAGRFGDRDVDLIDAMVMGADDRCSDEEAARIERCACPGCGSCSGMFTANSMNCLTEALGLSLPGNGTIVATHVARRRLFEEAAALIVRNAERYYFEGDDSLLPRSIATKAAFENAMSLDIAMGGSTNTVLHLLAVAHEAGVDFTMHDIDRLSRKVPVLCKVAPNSHYHIQDVNRAGGILSILGELDRAKLVDTSVRRIDGRTLGEAIAACDLRSATVGDDALGKEIIENFTSKGLNQLIAEVPYPTGTVQVEIDQAGIPQYEIKENVAWDNIPYTAHLEQLAEKTKAVCFGSLAQRNVVSRNTINRFLDAMPQTDDTLVVFDVNLRQGFYNKEILCNSMSRCNILKINDEELVTVSRMFGYPGIDLQDKCWILLGKYNLKMLILTCGINGSYVFTPGNVSFQPTPKVEVADTVGAGDSFTAAFISGILKGKSVTEAHANAVRTSAFVCTKKGAMPILPTELTE